MKKSLWVAVLLFIGSTKLCAEQMQWTVQAIQWQAFEQGVEQKVAEIKPLLERSPGSCGVADYLQSQLETLILSACAPGSPFSAALPADLAINYSESLFTYEGEIQTSRGQASSVFPRFFSLDPYVAMTDSHRQMEKQRYVVFSPVQIKAGEHELADLLKQKHPKNYRRQLEELALVFQSVGGEEDYVNSGLIFCGQE